jgi:prolyl oligopeptidase
LAQLDAPDCRLIAAQNAATFAALDRLPGRDRLHRRLTDCDYEKFGVPFRRGRHLFTATTACARPCCTGRTGWRRAARPARSGLARRCRAHRLQRQRRLAVTYGPSSGGSDWQVWHVREVERARSAGPHQWVKFSGASWTPDGQGFYYSRYDAPTEGLAYKGVNDNQQLCYHRLGTPQSDDVVVYRRPDEPEWGFDALVTPDGRYLIIHVWRGTHRENDVFYRDLAAPDAPIVALLAGFTAGYSFVGNDGPWFYFETDDDAPRGRLIAIDSARPARAHWRTLIPRPTRCRASVSVGPVSGDLPARRPQRGAALRARRAAARRSRCPGWAACLASAGGAIRRTRSIISPASRTRAWSTATT